MSEVPLYEVGDGAAAPREKWLKSRPGRDLISDYE